MAIVPLSERGVPLRFGAEQLSVRAGSSNRLLGGQVVQVREVRRHPAYNLTIVSDNDLSVLVLAEAITAPLAAPIPLADELPPPGTLAVVSGWGAVKVLPPGF